MSFEFVRRRLENNLPLSFLEFNYMMLQAYDYLELYDREGCVLQVGGADQWANILSGSELVRKLRGVDVGALTCPLITTASGAKMGKTAQGAVWLQADMKSPYDFWQFWRNTDDRDVGRFLRLFTFMPMDEIAQLEALDGAALNGAKTRLADEVTAFVHGPGCLESIHATAQGFFGAGDGDKGRGGHRPPCVGSDKVICPPAHALAGEGWSLLDCLVTGCGVTSKGEARRLIRAGAVRLEGEVVDVETVHLTAATWGDKPSLSLWVGSKNRFWVVQSQ